MDERPLVSVIIPIYNVEDYIHECINSVLDQTYQNIEVILIDDGSPDRCPEICDEYVEKDKRVRVIHKTNGGLSDARNCGIKNAMGEYLTFVDSDDVISSDMIQYLYRLCIKYDVLMAQCNHVTENPIFDAIIDGQERGTIIRKERCMNELLGKYGISFCVSWGKLFHRTVLDTIKFPVGKPHEDVYTTHLYFEAAEKIAFTTKRLYYYRQRESSLKAQEKKRPGLEELRANIERGHFFKIRGYETAYKNQIWNIINQIKTLYCKDCQYWSVEQTGYMIREYRKHFGDWIKIQGTRLPAWCWTFYIMPNIYHIFYRIKDGGRELIYSMMEK